MNKHRKFWKYHRNRLRQWVVTHVANNPWSTWYLTLFAGMGLGAAATYLFFNFVR